MDNSVQPANQYPSRHEQATFLPRFLKGHGPVQCPVSPDAGKWLVQGDRSNHPGPSLDLQDLTSDAHDTGFPSGPPCVQNSPFCWHELLGRRKFAGGSA